MAAHEPTPDDIARTAMSTASLWMIAHHEGEITEALEEIDLKEAIEEAEELIPWIEGTPWVRELRQPAEGFVETVKDLVPG